MLANVTQMQANVSKFREQMQANASKFKQM